MVDREPPSRSDEAYFVQRIKAEKIVGFEGKPRVLVHLQDVYNRGQVGSDTQPTGTTVRKVLAPRATNLTINALIQNIENPRTDPPRK